MALPCRLVFLAVAVALSEQPTLAASTNSPAAFPCSDFDIVRYTALRTPEAPRIDGKLDEPVWRNAPLSARYVDLISGGPTLHATHATLVWDDTNLYLGIRIEEPFVHVSSPRSNPPFTKTTTSRSSSAAPTPTTSLSSTPSTPRMRSSSCGRRPGERAGFAEYAVCPGQPPALQRRWFHHPPARPPPGPFRLALPRATHGGVHRRHRQQRHGP